MRGVQVMLLSTIVLWALNLTVSRYIIKHGFEPLAYSTVRYGAACVIFLLIVLVFERSLAIARRDFWLVGIAALMLFLNQVAFVSALDATTASTTALILGSTPIFAALIGLALRIERLSRRFWIAASVSFAGVGLVAVGNGELSGDLAGDLYGVATAATWAAYSVAVAPLMARYSASRISAIVLPLGWIGMAVVGANQVSNQRLDLGWAVWSLMVFVILGPLVATNVMWFRALHSIGAARATLVANLQPFLAAVFAVILLSEHIAPVQIVGGALIAGGILLARRRSALPPAGE